MQQMAESNWQVATASEGVLQVGRYWEAYSWLDSDECFVQGHRKRLQSATHLLIDDMYQCQPLHLLALDIIMRVTSIYDEGMHRASFYSFGGVQVLVGRGFVLCFRQL